MRIARGAMLGLTIVLTSCGGQQADGSFDTSVAKPTYVATHPKVLFDEAHENSHRANGTYRPFVSLLRNDGCTVTIQRAAFTKERLAGHAVLVIANAKGPGGVKYAPAFTAAELTAVEAWVAEGGALLLIVDHYPMGSAAQQLGARFGVAISEGTGVEDAAHADSSSRDPSRLVFTEEGGQLGDHPITRGREPAEGIRRVMTFTGAAVSVPPGGSPVLLFSPTATECMLIPESRASETRWTGERVNRATFGDPQSVAGRAQLVALDHGRGRVVISGEAAMLTAQKEGTLRFGMNVPGTDNRQLALNIMHWLIRAPG